MPTSSSGQDERHRPGGFILSPSERHRLLTSIFLGSCDLSGESRRRQLDLLCSDHPDLRSEVEELLSLHDAARTSVGTRFGIPSVGDLPWGSHICHFFRSPGDLVESLVPYFRAGIENRERCLWVTAEPLRAGDAAAELARVMPRLDHFLAERAIRIVDWEAWYSGMDGADRESVLDAWFGEEKEAALGGFTGLRIAGNLSFVRQEEMASLLEYESAVDETFPAHQIVAVCSYDLEHCEPADLSRVLRTHRFTLARKDGTWALAESASGSGFP